MTDEDAQDWIDDLTDPSDDDDSEDVQTGTTLFEENFRKMVETGDIEDMTVSTLREQVEKIEDPEILAEAIDADERTTAIDVYEDRIGEINAERQTAEDESEATEESDVSDESSEGAESGVSTEESEDDPNPPEGTEESSAGSTTVSEGSDDETTDEEESETDAEPDPEPEPESEPETESANDGLPDVDVSSLAPDAISREEAAGRDKQRTLLVWGPEGSGKSHVAHSAPEPICYIDTEGKADELSGKFDKRIHYFVADDYKEAKSALEQALDVLGEYFDAGVRGTLVVDSMTAMWEYAKVDYAKLVYQTEDLSEVNFQSELEGEKDWTKIKARHNEEFRERILESPYNVVFTSGQKEDYNAVFDGGGKQMIPDGEKWNKYAVKDVVRLRRDGTGRTVGDLRKAARTRYSFMDLVWPTWDDIYSAIDQIAEAEQADEEIDLTDWEFGVVDGQPVQNPSEGPDGDGGDDDE